jgi:hypothetical protein
METNMNTEMNTEVVVEPVTYANVVIDTPKYAAVHAAAVAAGVITADQMPARIALANGRWQVSH